MKQKQSNQNGQDTNDLNKIVMELDWDIEPGRDLWSGISKGMDLITQDRVIGKYRWDWIPYALAARILISVGSLLFSSISYDRTRDVNDLQAMLVLQQQSQIDHIEQQHKIVRAQFSQLLQQQKDRFDPSFVMEMQAILQIIDKATDELKAAILEQPYNPDYSLMLARTYQHEMSLINKIRINRDYSI